MKYGLLEPQFKEVIKIISSHPEIEEAVLFGSRAINTFKEASDVDIALKGKKVSYKLAVDLQSYFEEETDLPYFFDFASYSHITNNNLKKHINKYGIVIYRKGWRKVKLGDICQSANTGLDAIKRAPIVNYNSGIKCLRIQDISQRKDFEDWGYCEVNKKNYENFKITINDIFIARTGASIGVNRYFSQNLTSVYNNGLIRIRTNKKQCIAKYLYYNLCSPNYINFIKSISGGTSTQPNMKINALLNFELSLPLLHEQKTIVEVLSSLDDKIELLHEQNKTLEDMAQTLFRKWFIEDAKDSWKKTLLDKTVNIKYGKNLLTKNLIGSGYPVYGGNGIIGFYSQYHYNKPQVLISCRGEASGKVNISSPKSFITNNSLILEMLKDGNFLTFEFLKYYALSKNFKDYVSGSAQPQITIEDLSSVLITIPDQNSIDNFSKFTNSIEEKLLTNQSQIHYLEKLRGTLLPKLVTGSIRTTS